jgi:hypothetical protein
MPPTPLAFAFDARKFAAAFQALQYILSCKTIGDATAYDLFFEKQCHEGTAEALRLQSAMAYIDDIDAFVNRILDAFSAQKISKVLTIIKWIRGMTSLHVTEQHFFAVCALDGVVMRTGVQIHDAGKNVHITVQHKYKYFILAFWLITNIQTICQQRINSFVRINGRDKSIQFLIQSFNETLNIDDDDYTRVFTWAYDMVCECLVRTIDQHNAQLLGTDQLHVQLVSDT